MSARVQEGTGRDGLVGAGRADHRTRSPAGQGRARAGLDLTCTKVAVDFQSITIETPAERITAGLQSLTEACGADAVFVALLDDDAAAPSTGLRGPLDVLGLQSRGAQGPRSSTEFPWIKSAARAPAAARDQGHGRTRRCRRRDDARAARELERRRDARRRLQHSRPARRHARRRAARRRIPNGAPSCSSR